MSTNKSRWSALLLGTALALITGTIDAAGLQSIQERGFIEFAVYDDFFPFSYRAEDELRGIDVEIGRALASELGVEARFRSAVADESVEDDLRNNIWKGHYLGGGVADVMLHVPYNPAFSARVDQVSFVAPYFNEEMLIALNTAVVGDKPSLSVFTRKKIGVETATLADDYLMVALDGRLRQNIVHYRSLQQAVDDLLQGRITAVMGPRTQLQAGLGQKKPPYEIIRLDYPGLPQANWDLGLAVKADHDGLARKLHALIKVMRADGTIAAIFNRFMATYMPPESSLRSN